MIQIKVEVKNLDAVLASIGGRVKQVRFATAKALTDTAAAVRNAIPAALEASLDRPTPFTKRGVYLKPARRDDLEARVGFQEIQAAYLQYQVMGGTRPPKRRALRLPASIKLDQYGNLPRRAIGQLIESARQGRFGVTVQRRLGLAGDRRKRARGQKATDLFYGKPRGLPWPVGIYRRVPGRPGKLIPIIVFPQQAAKYRPRFRFYDMAERVVAREWPAKLSAALDYALATAR